MLTLPTELRSCIFSYLPQRDLLAAARTCQILRIQLEPTVWRKVEMAMTHRHSMQILLTCINQKIGAHVRNFSINAEDWIDVENLGSTLNLMPNLVELAIVKQKEDRWNRHQGVSSDGGVGKVFGNVSFQLRRLTYERCAYSKEFGAFLATQSTLRDLTWTPGNLCPGDPFVIIPSLVTLKGDRAAYEAVLTQSSNVRCVQLINSNPEDFIPIQFESHCAIGSLYLSKNEEDEVLFNVLQLRGLVYLRCVAKSSTISDVFIPSIGQNTSLQRLHFDIPNLYFHDNDVMGELQSLATELIAGCSSLQSVLLKGAGTGPWLITGDSDDMVLTNVDPNDWKNWFGTNPEDE